MTLNQNKNNKITDIELSKLFSEKEEVTIEDSNIVILDACVIISYFLDDIHSDKSNIIFSFTSLKSKKIVINQIQLFECRYILKQAKIINSDVILDTFIIDGKITIYQNSNQDFIVASDFKAKGGISPYDAFPLAQLQANDKAVFITFDKEFEKYSNELNIIVKSQIIK